MKIVIDTNILVGACMGSRGMSVNKLMDEAVTVMLAEFDAENRFKTRAALGDIPTALALLDKALI